MSTIEDAKLIVGFGFDFESEEDAKWLAPGKVDYWDFHERQYGGRRGIWRVLRVLDKYDINATFFTVAALIKNYPEACREIVDRGYEIAAHTVHHDHLDQLSPDEEIGMFELQAEMFGEFLGHVPPGFRTCFQSDRTLDVVADFGFYYDSTTRDDDRPYRMERAGGSYIEIPRGFNGDAPWIGSPVSHSLQHGRTNTAQEALEAWKWEFDWLRKEGEREQKLVTLCLHPFIIGHAARARALDRMLEYMTSFSDVYFASHLEVAQHFDNRNPVAVPDASAAA